MKYCRTTTENHPVALAHPDFLEDINTIIVAEGYSVAGVFNQGERVINIDKVKKPIFEARVEDQPKSMDMTVGLKSEDSSQKEMLLVEFKFNMENPNNLVGEDLTGKVAGSVLTLGNAIPVHDNQVFVFQSTLINQAKNRLARIRPVLPQTYIAMSIDDLKTIYFI